MLDPIALSNARAALADRGVAVNAIRFESDLRKAIAGSDAVLLVTSWPEYRQVPALLDAMKTKPLLVDGRRFINAGDYAHYTGIGRLPAKERGRFQ